MKVMVIHSRTDYNSDGWPFPPVGAIGETVSGIDEHNEYDVMFEGYPCPVINDPSWITHRSMIVELDEDNYLAAIREYEAII